MVMLVDLETAKQRLRVSHDADDVDIVAIIHEASDIVLRHIKTNDFIDSAGQVDPDLFPPVVRLATLRLVQIIYDGEEHKWEAGFLPSEVVSLLVSLRDPTIA